MVAVPMLGTVTPSYFDTVTFAGDSIASGLGIYDTGYKNAHYATYVSAGVQTFVNNVSVKNAVTGATETPMETIVASQPGLPVYRWAPTTWSCRAARRASSLTTNV